MQLRKFNKLITAVAIVPVLALGLVGYTELFSTGIEAAGVAVTATPNEIALTTATDVTFTYTASNAVENSGTTYVFIVNPALPSALADCTSADTQADATSGGTGSFGSFSTTGATFTTTNATTTTGRSLCLKFPSVATAASYGVTIVSSTGDFGIALIHFGDNNDVTVTATVAPTLSFNIRNLADSADTNVCDLGNVDTTTPVDLDSTDDGAGECGYSLAIGTNSATGFQATIDSNGALTNGTYNMTNVDDNGTFGTGTEEYGLANITAGTGVTENNTASYTYQTDTSPIPTTPNNFVSSASAVNYVAGTDASDVTLVMHGLTVAPATPTGNYTQTITYQVTANF